MMRLTIAVLFVVGLTSCNFADDVRFPGNPNNVANNSNNETTDMGDTNGGDTGGTSASVEVTNAMVNGTALPGMVPAQSEFELTADVLVTNSDGCADCNVQVVVSVEGGPGEPGCLIDAAPTGAAVASTAMLAGIDAPGTAALLYGVYEEATCAAAIAAFKAGTPSTSLGDVDFVEPAGLMVVASTPTADMVDVPVDSEIRVSFDATIDPSSVTNRVRLNDAGVQVPAGVNVVGSEIILTPSAPLTEFQTVYTVVVSSGITGNGRTLDSDFTASFSTRMFVPGVFYSAQDEFHGSAFALGIDSANQCVLMPGDQTAPAQRFRFVPRDGGWIGYNSAPVAATRALDGGDGIGNCAMVPLNATPTASQIWKFAEQPSGAFVIQNDRFGTAQSLDSTNLPPATAANPNCVTGGNACPTMQPTTTINRQFWRWTRLP